MARSFRSASVLHADKIQMLLASRGLSLSEVSRASSALAPESRLQRIPRNLYSSVRTRSFSPTLHQVFALSVLTGYRLSDWLTVFGVAIGDVARFQAAFPAPKTVELESSEPDAGHALAWFRENRPPDISAPLMPLTQWLALSGRALHRISVPSDTSHRYVKIGSQDAFAFPELLPGSIVRIRPLRSPVVLAKLGSKSSRSLFLVEQSNGLACARLCRSTNGKFVLCSRHLPYAPVELEEKKSAVMLGVADLEIRSLARSARPVVSAELGRFWTPAPLPQRSAMHAGKFIRQARLRAGISFRQASRRTRLIARKRSDHRYYCAASALSDYETQRFLPRHMQKLISLSAAYFADVNGLLQAGGVDKEKCGTIPMPPGILDPSDAHLSQATPSGFFSRMERHWGRLPYFLRNSTGAHFGVPDLSVRDIFWAGGVRRWKHYPLRGALFFVVDRRQKHPRPALSSPQWEQPVYLLLLREGTYLCGLCTEQNGTLILRSCSGAKPKLLRLRKKIDAEVVGRIVGVARRLRS